MSLPYQGVGDTTYYNNDYNVSACTGQSTVTETQGSPVSIQVLWEHGAGIPCICASTMWHEAHAAASSQLDVSSSGAWLLQKYMSSEKVTWEMI